MTSSAALPRHDAAGATLDGGAPRRVLGLAALLLLALGCRTQLWPKPMESEVDPLPKGVDGDAPAGLVEVLVYRYADPVQVRRPESPTAFPLTFFRKQQRMRSGAWVDCGAGGRAEVLWPADGAKIVLFDDGVCRIGEPSRGEPSIRFETLTRAEIHLSPGAVTQLPGGSLLTGPPDADAGPYLVQHVRTEVLRIFNQSGEPAYLSFREEEIALQAGERIDIPLLEAGGAPIDLGGPAREITGGRVRGKAYGDVAAEDEDGGMRVRSEGGRGVVLSQGVAVRLRPGEQALLQDFGGADPAPGEAGSETPESGGPGLEPSAVPPR